MPSPWQVECLLIRMESLRNEILRVKNKDRPYTETDIVYDSLVSVIDSRANLLHRAQKIAAAKGEQIDQGLFNHRAKDLETIFTVFSYTDRVDSPRIPFELLRSLSWVANRLFDESCYAVVRLEPRYNYSILSCRREFQKNGWSQYWNYAPIQTDVSQAPNVNEKGKSPVKKELQPNVLLLGFPSPDAGSTLVHALAAHEFGHEFAFKWDAEIKAVRELVVLEVKKTYNPDLQDYLMGLVIRREGESQEHVSEKARKYIFALIDTIALGWLREIFSDLAAARFVGPAFLAAFDRIIIGHSKAGDTHPASSLRRSLVRRYLRRLLPHIISDPVWADLFHDGETNSNATNELYRVIERVFDSLIIDALDPLLNKIPSALIDLTPSDLSELLEAMEDHIDHLATPSVPLKLGDRMPDTDKFWLLMFAAWHYRLGPRFETLRSNCGGKEDSSKAEEVLGNLLLHAVLSLELRAQWHNKHGSGGVNGGQR